MKKSELQQIIREEISKVLKEGQLTEWKKATVDDLVHDTKVKIVRGRHAGSIGTIYDFEFTDDGKLVDNQIDILVDKPGKPRAYLGLDDIMVETINR